MPDKHAIKSGRNPKRSTEGFKVQEPLAKRKRNKKDCSTEKPFHYSAFLQKTSPLSTSKPRSFVNKEDNRSSLKQLRRSSPKRNESAVSVDKSDCNSGGLKDVSKSATIFTKDCVLGKRSADSKNSHAKDDNKNEDILCFDAFTPMKEKNCKHQPDSYGLPLEKLKKMSLESDEVAELSQDRKVG